MFLSPKLTRLVQMFLSQNLTRFVEMLLFAPIDSLNVIVIIAVTGSFLLHAEINRFDLISSLAVIPGGGSLLMTVIMPLIDSLCLNVIIPTDDSLCPNAVINRLWLTKCSCYYFEAWLAFRHCYYNW